MERKPARVYAAEPPPRPEADCAALRGAFFPQQACAPRKERAPVYTAEHTRPFASYAPRRLRGAFPPDSAASRYRPSSHLQTHQADRHPCVASRRPQPSPEAGRVVPARHNDRPDLPQKCIWRRHRPNGGIAPAGFAAGKGRVAPFSSGQGRRVSARRYSKKAPKALHCKAFGMAPGAPPPRGGGGRPTGGLSGGGDAPPMGRLSRRKAVLQHRRNSQRPKKEIGDSQRRESAAILETEILCKSSIGLRLTCLPQGLLQAPAPVEIHANAPLKKPKAQPSGRLGGVKAS